MLNVYVPDEDHMQAKHDAFTNALIELFRAHPIPEHMHDLYHAARGSTIRRARAGGYNFPGGRNTIEERSREDLLLPPEAVAAAVTAHTLIYG